MKNIIARFPIKISRKIDLQKKDKRNAKLLNSLQQKKEKIISVHS